MQHSTSRSLKAFTLIMALFTFTIGLTPASFAGAVPSDVIIKDVAGPDLVLQQALEDKVVQARLESLGFTQAEVQQRLARLDADQRHELATQIEAAQTAADSGAFVAVLLIAAIIAVVWFLVHEVEHDHHHDNM